MRSSSTAFNIVAGLILAALLGLAGYIVYKSYAFKAETASIVAQGQVAASRAEYLSSLRGALRDSNTDIQSIEGRFIHEEAVPEFIDSLERLAAENGVTSNIGSISLDAAVSAEGIKALHVRIAGTGTWAQSIRFIAALDSLPRALRVDSVSFQQSAGEAAWAFTTDITQYVAN